MNTEENTLANIISLRGCCQEMCYFYSFQRCNFSVIRVIIHTEKALYSNYIFLVDLNLIVIVGEDEKGLTLNK